MLALLKSLFGINLFIFFLHLGLCAFGQVTISGTVADETGVPIPSATVLLLEPVDSLMVKGEITDNDGIFYFQNVEPGVYRLSVSVVGFERYLSQPFEAEPSEISLDSIQLSESVEQLEEVSVTARRPLFEQQIDRLVVNVQQSITAAGSSVLETLEKSPGIRVNRQNGSISMNGRSGVRIMINDRAVELPADAVIQMLDGMNAANVEQIELISNPPARYEAEGDAGIININMIEHTNLGYTGSVGGNLGYNWAEILGGHVNFSKRDRKLAYFINYSINHDRTKHRFIIDRLFSRGGHIAFENSSSDRRPIVNVQNLRAGLEVSLSPRTSVSGLFTGYRRNWDMDSITDTHIQHSPGEEMITQMNIHESNIWRNIQANVGLNHNFNENRSLQTDLSYMYYLNTNPSIYDHQFIEGNPSIMNMSGIDVEKRTPIRFWVARFDYEEKLSESFTFETGIKGTVSHFINDVSVSEFIDGSWVTNPRFSNEADLSEKIGGAYLSGRWVPTEGLQVNAGLRYEFTDSFLSTPDRAGLVDREEGHFFPSLFLRKEISDTKNVGLAYSRRISRPTFNDMAPFVFFLTPTTFMSGNPALKPAISDAIMLDYQHNRWLISLQYSHTNNEIGPFQSSIDPDTNEQVYKTENMDFLRTYSITTSFPFEPWHRWEVQANITGRYQDIKSGHLQENITDNAAGATVNVTNTFTLPADFTLEISGYYQSKSIWGLTHFKPQGAFNIGLQKRIFDGQGILRLAANDLLYTDYWRANVNPSLENLNQIFEYDFRMQNFNITFTWNFGSSDLESVTIRSGAEEEQGRVNTN